MELFEYLESKGVRVDVKISTEVDVVVNSHSVKHYVSASVTLRDSETGTTYSVCRDIPQRMEALYGNSTATWIVRHRVEKFVKISEVWNELMETVGLALTKSNIKSLVLYLPPSSIPLECAYNYLPPQCPVSIREMYSELPLGVS